jgi:uncharacterized protein (DUF1501 family)
MSQTSPECHGCNEYMQLSRRQFLAASGGAAVATMVPAWLPRVAFATDYCSSRDIIVTVFLRGAADGLTLCVPHADNDYYTARPNLAVPRPDSPSPNKAIDLDGFFGFPQPLAPLIPAYQAGHLLIAHACGSPDSGRSHFDSMRHLEEGKVTTSALFSGWIGRHLSTAPPIAQNSILRAIGIDYGLQRALVGGPQTIPIPDLAAFNLTGDPASITARRAALSDMYSAYGGQLSTACNNTQVTLDLLHQIDFVGYQPAGGAVYPVSNSFGYGLRSAAALIKAEVGVEAIALDLNGWDTHVQQGVFGGAMFNLMTSLAQGLAAFHTDINAGNGRNVTVVVMSEFGRRLMENGGSGTDHGHGTVMFVMGNNIAGGRVLTQWPGLAPGQLFEERDLAVTMDWRDILSEIVYYRLGNPNLGIIFPEYAPTFHGVTNSCSAADMNCDGAATADDVEPFVQAVMDPEGYRAEHPQCNVTGADRNSDGRIDGLDVANFTQSLVNP